jgi:leucyl-tRNA synthetase
LIGNKGNFGEIMKILNNDAQTAITVRKNVALIRKLVEDILSIPVEVRQRRLNIGESFDEAYSIRDAAELLSTESTNHLVEIQVYPEVEENDKGKVQRGTKYMDRGFDVQHENYDPKSRANHSRPFKPAVYIE